MEFTAIKSPVFITVNLNPVSLQLTVGDQTLPTYNDEHGTYITLTDICTLLGISDEDYLEIASFLQYDYLWVKYHAAMFCPPVLTRYYDHERLIYFYHYASKTNQLYTLLESYIIMSKTPIEHKPLLLRILQIFREIEMNLCYGSENYEMVALLS